VKFSRHGVKFIRRNFYVRGDGTCCYYYTEVGSWCEVQQAWREVHMQELLRPRGRHLLLLLYRRVLGFAGGDISSDVILYAVDGLQANTTVVTEVQQAWCEVHKEERISA
jgi:hypothetical protein